jgi:hypothetical protein
MFAANPGTPSRAGVLAALPSRDVSCRSKTFHDLNPLRVIEKSKLAFAQCAKVAESVIEYSGVCEVGVSYALWPFSSAFLFLFFIRNFHQPVSPGSVEPRAAR